MIIKKLSIFVKLLLVIFVLNIYFSSANTAQAACPPTVMAAGSGTDLCGFLTSIASDITAGSAPVTAGATGATAATTGLDLAWSAVGKNLLDYAAYTAAQNLLTQLTNNTVKWIQGGFHGSPSFAVDTDQILTEIADSIAGNLVLKIRGLQTCNFTASYKDDLANAIYLEPKKRDYIFDNKATCPFREDYNFKASDFYAGASRFTWDAFGSALEDSGNPYGLETITAKEKEKREAEAKTKKEKKLSWSNGYADVIDINSCNYPPGLFLQEGSLRVMTDEEMSNASTDLEAMATSDGTNQVGMTQAEANGYNAQLLSDPTFAKNIQDQYCKTTTPGKIVGDQLTKSLGIEMDRIGFADNMNKIIAAFLDQITQQTIRGVFGKGDRSWGSSGGSSRSGGTSGNSGSWADAPAVEVTTLTPENVTQTTAILKGSVNHAWYEANVSVWFRWSNTVFSRDALDASTYVTSKPSLYTTGDFSKQPQNFSVDLTGLTPNTIYYYNANMATSQTVADTNKYGEVLSFTTLP